MTDVAKLGFEIDSRRDAKRATGDLDKLSGAAGRADKAAMGMSSRFKIAAAVIGVGFVAAMAGAVAAMHKFINNTIVQQNAVKQLETVLKSTGGVVGYTSKQLQDMASGFQDVTLYGDETILSAEALLLTFPKLGHDAFPAATEAVLNVATAMHQDLKSAAIQVGKALNDPKTGMDALTRSGITFSEAQKSVIKGLVDTGKVAEAQKIILKELETQFGGSARAMRGTLSGAIDSLGNAWGDLFELSSQSTEGIVGNVNELTKKLKSQDTKAAFETFGNWMISAANGMVGAVVTVINAVQRLNDLMSNNANKSTSGLEERLRSLGIEGDGIENRLMKLNRELSNMAPGARTAFAGEITNLERSRADNLAEQARILDELAKRDTPAETAPTIPGISIGGGGGSGGLTGAHQKAADAYDKLIKSAQQRIAQAGIEAQALGMTTEAANRLRIEQELLNKAANDNIKLTPAQTAQLQGLATATAAAEERTRLLTQAANDNAQIWGKVQDGASGFFKTLARGGDLVDYAKNKLLDFGDALLDLSFKYMFMGMGGGGGNPLGFLASLFLPSANGNVFPGGIGGYSNQVVSQPTVFAYANGGTFGVMGEAGPEAVMPLKRGADGKLGVQASNGNNSNVNLNVTVSVDENGNLQAFVQNEAGKIVAKSAPMIVNASVGRANKSAPGALARYQLDRAGGDWRG
jgi:hypothetical protein